MLTVLLLVSVVATWHALRQSIWRHQRSPKWNTYLKYVLRCCIWLSAVVGQVPWKWHKWFGFCLWRSWAGYPQLSEEAWGSGRGLEWRLCCIPNFPRLHRHNRPTEEYQCTKDVFQRATCLIPRFTKTMFWMLVVPFHKGDARVIVWYCLHCPARVDPNQDLRSIARQYEARTFHRAKLERHSWVWNVRCGCVHVDNYCRMAQIWFGEGCFTVL